MLFEVIQIEVQCNKNYFRFFLPQKTAAFGNNIEKELQKSGPKLKNIYIFTENICSPAIQCEFFCKNGLILLNNDSNFLTLKVT